MNHHLASVLVLFSGLAASCAGGDPGSTQGQVGTWQLVRAVDARWDPGEAQAAMVQALASHAKIDGVFAHDAGMAMAAAAACREGRRSGVRIVGIGLADAIRTAVADGSLDAAVEQPTGAVATIDLALLASNGIALPPAVAVGTRVFTKANLATGGQPVPAPGDFVLELLRRQHSKELDTQPAIDIAFQVGVALAAEQAPAERAQRDELIAAARRYPQVALSVESAGGDAARLGEIVRSFTSRHCNVIVVVGAADLVTGECKAAMAQNIKVIALGGEPATGACTTHIVCDEARLGEAAAQQLEALLGAGGGHLVELQGAMTSAQARQRSAGFRRGLRLPQKP